MKIHNGQMIKTFLVQLEHIGHKFGEFHNTKIGHRYKKGGKN